MFGPVSEGMNLFRTGCKVAIVGYSDKPTRVVSKIAKFLAQQGNSITGINPKVTPLNGSGISVTSSLAELQDGADIIQVFRNSTALPDLAEEILTLPWRPKLVWCQQGVYDLLFQQRLEDEGIMVVMDACPYALRSYL